MVEGIRVEGVARSFGTVHAVRSASFAVEPGSVTGLIGPNGSGKTTMMLMLASLLRPDAGTVMIAGHDTVEDPEAVRRVLGWMPDVLGVWSTLTVREVLVAIGTMYGLSRQESGARASELIGLVGLSELADYRSDVLSRGQKQRLSLARALVHRPSVLLLDEPASGLDPAARIELRTIIKSLAADGASVLVTSPVLDEPEEMTDRVLFIKAGMTSASDEVTAALSAGRYWRVRALDDEALSRAFESAGLVSTAESGFGGTTRLIPFASDATAAQTLTWLVAQGVSIAEFAPAQGALEQAFIQLSGVGHE